MVSVWRLQEEPEGVSVICPDFVAQDGMYARKQGDGKPTAHLLLKTTTPEKIAAAVVKVIREDLAENHCEPFAGSSFDFTTGSNSGSDNGRYIRNSERAKLIYNYLQ